MLVQQAQLVRIILGARMARLREVRRRRDVGATAIELAIITAIIVGLAVFVLIIVNNVVRTRANQINNNNNGIP